MRFRRVLRGLWPRLLKKWLPRSLFGRSLLIIVLPIALMQGATVWGFFEAHLRAVNQQLSTGLAGDVAMDVGDYQADPTPQTLARIAARAERLQSVSIVLQPHGRLPEKPRPSLFPSNDDALRQAIDDQIPENFWVDTTRYPAYVDVRVAVKGGVLRIIAPRDRVFAARGHAFIWLLTFATLLLTGVAVLFIRNQVRSIERLAAAAEAFGKGVDVRFKPHGAREVRAAAHAFLDMRERIQRHIDQRTTLLAAVSHDLRTPLTRLKLEVALAPPAPHMDAIRRDVEDMEHMVEEYLAFARGEGGEPAETVDVSRLVSEVSRDAARGAAQAAVHVSAPAELQATLRPMAMKRALANLVANAAAYARKVEVEAARSHDGGLEIRVDDDGPGIAPENYEEAFRPFSRLDAARNPNAKGVGLGLAIARDVARSHGGDVLLDRSRLGGLRAVIRLPG
jgi:two-component system, OmpR family, osmolarity sensor histidine kinase EnvZ